MRDGSSILALVAQAPRCQISLSHLEPRSFRLQLALLGGRDRTSRPRLGPRGRNAYPRSGPLIPKGGVKIPTARRRRSAVPALGASSVLDCELRCSRCPPTNSGDAPENFLPPRRGNRADIGPRPVRALFLDARAPPFFFLSISFWS